MKKLNEQKQLLQDLENLISKMDTEIETLRYIIYRYYLMHGIEVQDGVVNLPENISFSISQDAKCRIVDHNKINIKSNYQEIKSIIQKLS